MFVQQQQQQQQQRRRWPSQQGEWKKNKKPHVTGLADDLDSLPPPAAKRTRRGAATEVEVGVTE